MELLGALDGIKVVDMSRLLPGPYCSMILGDHGARVIAVEDRRFLADNFFVRTVNRNKEHMTLNLKTDGGREIFWRLIRDADVFIEGFRPGVVQRLGIDYPAVNAINPGMVYCAISGYGQSGDHRELAGHDVNYLATAGVLDQIGEAGSHPVIPGVQIADIAGGTMNAVTGILLALFARQHSGKGQYIDISMTDACMGLLPLVLHFRQEGGATPVRGNARLSHRYACYNVYETADGRFIAVGAVENRFWRRLCTHLGVPEYADQQYDDAHRRQVIDHLQAIFKGKTLVEWTAALEGVDACWAPVNQLDEVLQSPLFKQRGMVLTLPDEQGHPKHVLGVPVKLSATPGAVRTPPPRFGQHTAQILAELGYSQDQIESFQAQEVV